MFCLCSARLLLSISKERLMLLTRKLVSTLSTSTRDRINHTDCKSSNRQSRSKKMPRGMLEKKGNVVAFAYEIYSPSEQDLCCVLPTWKSTGNMTYNTAQITACLHASQQPYNHCRQHNVCVPNGKTRQRAVKCSQKVLNDLESVWTRPGEFLVSFPTMLHYFTQAL